MLIVRQAGLVVYLLAATAYLTAFVLLPLSRRLNPYFAARQLERMLPDAKNSVVNWLDLRETNLPPAIRGAVGQCAARAVAGADPDKAVSGRRAWTAGVVAAVCAAAFVVALFTVGVGPFCGFLGRVFSPFGATAANTAANAGPILRPIRVFDFKAVYTFRPYTAKPAETRTGREIRALRGTQVDVTVHTNRDVKDGWLQMDTAGAPTMIHGQTLPGEAQGFTVHLTLDESGPYRIGFLSAEGENFVEPQSSPLIAVPDNPPVVALTQPMEQKAKPGWISDLRADEPLQLEGLIRDDVGVAAARLGMKKWVGKLSKDKDGKDVEPPEEEYRALPSQEYRSRDCAETGARRQPILGRLQGFRRSGEAPVAAGRGRRRGRGAGVLADGGGRLRLPRSAKAKHRREQALPRSHPRAAERQAGAGTAKAEGGKRQKGCG